MSPQLPRRTSSPGKFAFDVSPTPSNISPRVSLLERVCVTGVTRISALSHRVRSRSILPCPRGTIRLLRHLRRQTSRTLPQQQHQHHQRRQQHHHAPPLDRRYSCHRVSATHLLKLVYEIARTARHLLHQRPTHVSSNQLRHHQRRRRWTQTPLGLW